MTSLKYKTEIINQIDRLNTEQRKEVLSFVQLISTKKPTGVPGNQLLRASGTIGQDDLHMMSKAIKDGCEKVNLNEW